MSIADTLKELFNFFIKNWNFHWVAHIYTFQKQKMNLNPITQLGSSGFPANTFFNI